MPRPYAPEDVRFFDKIDLAALPMAVNCSRLFTKFVLFSWGAPALLDDACLVVSEMVTNAVEETGYMGEQLTWNDLSRLTFISVRMVGLHESIVFEVWDSSTELPVVQNPGLEDEGGRGLHLIEELSRQWGHYPADVGKWVWAELPVYPKTSCGLPKRQRSEQLPGTPPVVCPDPDLLRQVIEDLEEW